MKHREICRCMITTKCKDLFQARRSSRNVSTIDAEYYEYVEICRNDLELLHSFMTLLTVPRRWILDQSLYHA